MSRFLRCVLLAAVFVPALLAQTSKALISGIVSDSSGAAITGAKVAPNTLTTADIAGADVSGGGINVPTGYVPNGRCRQLGASVGGATAGEAVVFSIKARLLDGVVIYGQRVPRDGPVMCSGCMSLEYDLEGNRIQDPLEAPPPAAGLACRRAVPTQTSHALSVGADSCQTDSSVHVASRR